MTMPGNALDKIINRNAKKCELIEILNATRESIKTRMSISSDICLLISHMWGIAILFQSSLLKILLCTGSALMMIGFSLILSYKVMEI